MNSTRCASSDYASGTDFGGLLILVVVVMLATAAGIIVAMIRDKLKQAKQEEDEEEVEQTPLSESRANEAETLHETLVPIYIQQSV
jgi:flagellar basal body-associated protein FliL